MILSFMRSLEGDPTYFVPKIINGVKRHTLRRGHRWTPGTVIDFWDMNPRGIGRTKPDPAPFHPGPDVIRCFKQVYKAKKGGWIFLPICTATEDFKMTVANHILEDPDPEAWRGSLRLWVGGYEIWGKVDLEKIAKNDGLTYPQFEKYFFKTVKKHGTQKENAKEINGQIIHWINEPYFTSKARIFKPAYTATRLPLYLHHGEDQQ